jgi:hypothetical protein
MPFRRKECKTKCLKQPNQTTLGTHPQSEKDDEKINRKKIRIHDASIMMT